jgi:phenylalanyl-tRNA synthetase alpha chain
MTENIENILASFHPLEGKLLSAIKLGGPGPFAEEALLQASQLDESRFTMAMGWLLTKNLLTAEAAGSTTTVTISELGRQYLSQGFPILTIVQKLKSGNPMDISGLRREMDPLDVSKAIGELKNDQSIQIAAGGVLELKRLDIDHSKVVGRWQNLKKIVENISEKESVVLETCSSQEKNIINLHGSGRGKKGIFSLQEKRHKSYHLTVFGKKIIGELDLDRFAQEEITQLTPEMLKEGSWRNKTFRHYNITLKPSRAAMGRKHPYREFLDTIKMKLVGMGFQEMRGGLVESEFWNSDALFMPQFHPARAIHDVYFVRDPKNSRRLPKDILEKVAKTHETGGKTGSTGWRYSFKNDRAKRLVLRSQGTAVSARTLASGPNIPGKYFSLARCFRYDKVDATHAPDFYQVEGIVLGEGIHFRTLLGLLKLFAVEMARAKEIKFLPAYFPYTEPSVEIHAKHPQLGWMELGGNLTFGCFRSRDCMGVGSGSDGHDGVGN